MSTIDFSTLPRLDVTIDLALNEDDRNLSSMNQIRAFAALAESGTSFQVWYPESTEADYDVLHVSEDDIVVNVTPTDEQEALDALA